MKVRIDRRAEVLEHLKGELHSLSESVEGLQVEFAPEDVVEQARDEGKFRDFVDVATVRHDSGEVVEWVAEELVAEFGWLVDVTRSESEE